MPILSRRLAPAAFLLATLAELLCVPRVWAQGTGGFDPWGHIPAWVGMIGGLLAAAFAIYASLLQLRRDVAGLRRVVFGEQAGEKDGLLHRVGEAERHAGDRNLHPPILSTVPADVCRQQRSDCAAIRAEVMTALREDVRRVEAKLDRLLEKGQ